MQRKTFAEIDLAALRHNIKLLDDGQAKLIGVVKANAYGHGIEVIAQELVHSGVEVLAVAFIDEAVLLRTRGIRQPILVLEGPMAKDELEWMLAHECWPMLHTPEQFTWLPKHSEPSVPIWCKLDTGMHRLGLSPEELEPVLSQTSLRGIKNNIVLATHFACADTPNDPFSQQQLAQFTRIQQRFKCPVSISNSAGHIYQLGRGIEQQQYARVGISLYGCAPNNQVEDIARLELRPVMTLQAPVLALRQIKQGGGVGYGQSWRAERDCLIATVAIGYADGYPRHASNCAQVMLNGVTCPVVGQVSMDMITIDVTDASVNIGDWVELWGKKCPVEQLANAIGTINYECVTRVSERVPRLYLDPQQID